MTTPMPPTLPPPPAPAVPPISTAPPNCDQPAPSGTNGFAVATLVLGILAPCGGGLLSVIFGIIALVQIRRRRQGGKKLAIAGLAITGAWVAAILTVVVIGLTTGEPRRNDAGEIVNAGPVSANDLAPGDCLRNLDGVDFDYPGVPCAEPHEAEVFAVFDVTLSGGWPGEEAVAAEGEDGCLSGLASYSPAAMEDELVDVYLLYPTQISWLTGDREVVCLAYFLDGLRTGSLAG